MPTPKINAVATATPPHRFSQARVLELAGYGDTVRQGFFANSQIEGRYLYLDPARVRTDETVDELNDRFCRGALEIGEAAARRALAQAGWAPADLDFLATTTCTGRMTPSLDAHLIARLGCRAGVQRVHVGDTGCASAMVALQQAWNHLEAFPAHRALVLAVEICSAAYYLDERLESAVAHAIFADGAGAVALSTRGAGVSVVCHRTRFRSEHLPAMGFEYPGGAGAQAGRYPLLGAPLGRPARHRAGPGAARADRAADCALARGAAPVRQYVVGDDPVRARGDAPGRAPRARRVGPDDRAWTGLRRRGRSPPFLMR